jgi:phosphatidylserine decarboxylase
MKNYLFDLMMPLLPKNDLSHWVGRMVHHPLPKPLARKSVEWFAKAYSINMNEAELPLSEYKTIGELFTRRLKPGVRPIGSGVLHPADSVMTEAGRIENQTLLQAKGRSYALGELLAGGHHLGDFEGGGYATYYLCPTDYHRVHSPVDGEIIWSCHVPGELWPVNEWSVHAVPHLFTVNERIVTLIQTPKGKVALVMVAATNVGNMTMSFDSGISTRVRKPPRQPRDRRYEPAIPIHRGDEIGIFHMGSTVIMVYEKGVIGAFDFTQVKGQNVRMGETLIETLSETPTETPSETAT